MHSQKYSLMEQHIMVDTDVLSRVMTRKDEAINSIESLLNEAFCCIEDLQHENAELKDTLELAKQELRRVSEYAKRLELKELIKDNDLASLLSQAKSRIQVSKLLEVGVKAVPPTISKDLANEILRYDETMLLEALLELKD